MENKELVLFENKKIRRVLVDGEWFYSVVDIVGILTRSDNPNDYWYKMKKRMTIDGYDELSTNCRQLKLVADDNKKRYTDCANREGIFRIIQSIPSPNAEPFKLWFARLAEERIEEIIEPSLAIERARQTYLKKGYTEEWTNARIKSISARGELTDEWKKRGVTSSMEFALLTDEISLGTFDLTTKEHKEYKSLDDKQNLRDNMSSIELALTTLAEVTTTELHRTNDSEGFDELKVDAHDGGEVASIARKSIENKLGRSVVTKKTAIDFNKNKQLNIELNGDE